MLMQVRALRKLNLGELKNITHFQVVANVVCWSVIAMLKKYLFIALAVSVLAVLGALKLHEKCCSTRKQKDLESNQEEENQPEGQPLNEQRKSGGQKEIQFKLESPAGEKSNQTGRKELADESKNNEGVLKHKKARRSQKDDIQAEGLPENTKAGTSQKDEKKVSSKELEEGQAVIHEAEAGTNKDEVGEDLQPNVSMRSTMSGLCSCLASLWVCVFLPCVCVFCCCCSEFPQASPAGSRNPIHGSSHIKQREAVQCALRANKMGRCP